MNFYIQTIYEEYKDTRKLMELAYDIVKLIRMTKNIEHIESSICGKTGRIFLEIEVYDEKIQPNMVYSIIKNSFKDEVKFCRKC